MNKALIIVLLLVALLAGTSLALFLNPAAPAEPRVATLMPDPTPVPAFELTDHEGNTQSRDLFLGDWHLLFFGFTHCPDICPMTLAALSTARQQLAESGQEPLPGIVLVSVDPERDTPQVLREYLGHFGGGHTALTGSEAALRELTEPLFIYFNKVALEGGDYTMDHSSAVLLISPEGRFHALFSGPHSVENFVHDLPVLVGQQS